jgi:hypothetical protein
MLKRRFDNASEVLERDLYNLNNPTNQFMRKVGENLYKMSYISFLELRISKTKELTDFEKDLRKNQLRIEN